MTGGVGGACLYRAAILFSMIPKIRGPLLPYMEPGRFFHVSLEGLLILLCSFCHNVSPRFCSWPSSTLTPRTITRGIYIAVAKKRKAKQRRLCPIFCFGRCLPRKRPACGKEAKTLQWGNVAQADSCIHSDLQREYDAVMEVVITMKHFPSYRSVLLLLID